MLATLRLLACSASIAVAFIINTQQALAQPTESARLIADCYGEPTRSIESDLAARRSALHGPPSMWTCAPPYELPAYTKPADDSVAFESLLEAAGHTPTANGDWLGVAAGSFCGDAEKQMVLVQNRAPNFSLLHGPTPHRRPIGGTANLQSNASHPWRGMIAAKLDGGEKDQFIAVRKVATTGVPDLIVGEITTCSCSVFDVLNGRCELPTVVASKTIGNPANSDWVGVAVGNFDGNGKQIALLKAKHSNLFLVKLDRTGGQAKLTITHREDLDTLAQPSKWKAVAAGDIDSDGIDELIVARQMSNGKPTVLALKWDAGAQRFRRFATSNFGSNGNSDWTAAAVGDFNGDGRQAIVLVKNKHSNFVALDLKPGATQLRILPASDLVSADGQKWTALAATDWMRGDQNASELIPVRAARQPYRTSLFVYGNAFHRMLRDSALAGTKAQWDGVPDAPIEDIKSFLRRTHTNAFLWLVQKPGDYAKLVAFLHATQNWGVGGRQLRVWVTFISPRYATDPDFNCARPEESPFTSWSALDFFPYITHTPPTTAEVLRGCKDVHAWAKVVGRLAQDFPHVVAMGYDDFSQQLDGASDAPRDRPFQADDIAGIQGRLRAQSPWLSFAPFMYYPLLRNGSWKDVGLTLDSMVFFFRNEKRQTCIGPTPECDRTIDNAADEIADMTKVLPGGRKMLLGSYWVGLWSQGGPNAGIPPTTRYDYDLTRLGLNLPVVGSSVAYGFLTPGIACTDSNFLDDRFCTLRQVYGMQPQQVTPTDLTPNGASAQSNPVAYFASSDNNNHAIYRTANGHLHELWWSTGAVGQGDLIPNGPPAAGDPAAHFDSTHGTQHVVYRGRDDNRLHELSWTTGAVTHRDLTPFGPAVSGDPAAHFVTADAMHHAVYRSGGHLQEVRWDASSIAQRDLIPQGPAAASDPSIYFMSSDATHHAIYRSSDNHLHELWWTTGLVGQGDLTSNSGAPDALGDAASYFVALDGTQHVIYRSSNGHLHELWWTTGDVGHGDLTSASNAPLAQSNPVAYFVPADGTQHVIYRSSDGRLHELWWTTSIVTHNDLTALSSAPANAVGDPSAFVAAGGSQHVIYRTGDGHIRELRWGK